MNLKLHFPANNIMANTMSALIFMCILSRLQSAPIDESIFAAAIRIVSNEDSASGPPVSNIQSSELDIEIGMAINAPEAHQEEQMSQLSLFEYRENSKNEIDFRMMVIWKPLDNDNNEDIDMLPAENDEMNFDGNVGGLEETISLKDESQPENEEGELPEKDCDSEEEGDTDCDSLDCAIIAAVDDIRGETDNSLAWLFDMGLCMQMTQAENTTNKDEQQEGATQDFTAPDAPGVFMSTFKCSVFVRVWFKDLEKSTVIQSSTDSSNIADNLNFEAPALPMPTVEITANEMKDSPELDKGDQDQGFSYSSASDSKIFVEIPSHESTALHNKASLTTVSNGESQSPQMLVSEEEKENAKTDMPSTLSRPTSRAMVMDTSRAREDTVFSIEVNETKYLFNPMYIFPILVFSLIVAVFAGMVRSRYGGKSDNSGKILKVPRMGIFSDFPNLSALTPQMKVSNDSGKKNTQVV